jgi:hypothetical protein
MGIFVGVGGALFGGIMGYLSIKRKNSGKIATSEAAVLWQQSESMRKSLESQLARTEDQRDRVMDLFERQMLPALGELAKNQATLNTSIEDVLELLKATGPIDKGLTLAFKNRVTDATYDSNPKVQTEGEE